MMIGKWELNSIQQADLFELCSGLPEQSVDMILCDLPYGTIAQKWDQVIPFDQMWAAFKRVIKPRAAIVLTGSDPFSTRLKMSNFDWYKYSWIWIKTISGDVMNAKNKPLKRHEDVMIFSEGTVANKSPRRMPYYPQGLRRARGSRANRKLNSYGKHGGSFKPFRPSHKPYRAEFEGYPNDLLYFSNDIGMHPTQKPVALFEYLIRTYTRPGEIVLDPCVGSGTTAIAARQAGRSFICGDLNPAYVKTARERLEAPYTPSMFALLD